MALHSVLGPCELLPFFNRNPLLRGPTGPQRRPNMSTTAREEVKKELPDETERFMDIDEVDGWVEWGYFFSFGWFLMVYVKSSAKKTFGFSFERLFWKLLLHTQLPHRVRLQDVKALLRSGLEARFAKDFCCEPSNLAWGRAAWGVVGLGYFGRNEPPPFF